ncbi:MAG TPA: hypothetical protein VHX68_18575 [Planctomycetaceae bacterium]|nr:hypothetical protein [Planctomycetaceae bacterium]
MRLISAAALFGMVVGVAGCTQQSAPGGPGVSTQSKTTTSSSTSPASSAMSTTTTTAHKPVVTDKNNTFTLEVPKMTTSVNRGKKEDVTISISRGTEFKESVKLHIHAPKGVTVTPAEPVIQAGQNKVTITIQAAGDAPAGKANMDVTAVPQTGKSVSLQMPLEVKHG